MVGLPILFTDKTFVLDFTSIATLFAFVLVCAGVLLIPKKEKIPGAFNLPYINGRYIFPLIVVSAMVAAYLLDNHYFQNLFNFNFSEDSGYAAGKSSYMDLAIPNISLIIFWCLAIMLSMLAYIKNYSLIPLLGCITCLYLLTGMTKENWAWFTGWLILGLIIYMSYGRKHSKLATSG